MIGIECVVHLANTNAGIYKQKVIKMFIGQIRSRMRQNALGSSSGIKIHAKCAMTEAVANVHASKIAVTLSL